MQIVTFRKYTLLVILAIIPFSMVQAQDHDSSKAVEPGSKALQFQISENFTLESFTGYSISYKKQLSESKARRIGLTLNGDLRNEEQINSTEDRDRGNLNLALDLVWLNYTDPAADIKFYYGFGPGVYLRLDKSETDGNLVKRTNINNSYGLSAYGITGVEWFFHPSMSLLAEYQNSIQVSYNRQKITNENNGVESSSDSASNTSLSLGGNGVRFGLSVYF